MEKLKILFTILVSSSSALAASMLLLLLVSEPDLSPIDVILLTLTEGPPTHIPFFFPLASLLFFSLTLAGVVGVVYYLVMPEIKMHQGRVESMAAELVLKTLKPDEQRVVAILRGHGGRYLQKYIAKEAELSKLKTHRIVARLSERGLVTVKRYSNTNEVILADWLLGKPYHTQKPLKPRHPS